MINGTEIKSSPKEKDLGVWYSENGKVSLMCQTAANKGNWVLGIIKRNFIARDKYLLTKLYRTYVRPHLEYAIQAYSPSYMKDVNILESVQKRFIRLVRGLEATNYEDKLKELNLTTLEERRKRGDAIQVFKIIHGYENLDVSKFFTFTEQVHSLQTRSCAQKHISSKAYARNFGKHTFSRRSVAPWNSLPLSVRNSSSVTAFKCNYDRYMQNNKCTN